MQFSIIAALDNRNGIGIKGGLPWKLPGDMKHFKDVTCGSVKDTANVVIMGRKTWESIPERFRPLSGRINVVLTRNYNLKLPTGVVRCSDFQSIELELDKSEYKNRYGEMFVIGGQQIYEEAIQSSNCRRLYITHVESDFDCDAFFPDFSEYFHRNLVSEHLLENGINYYFAEYLRL